MATDLEKNSKKWFLWVNSGQTVTCKKLPIKLFSSKILPHLKFSIITDVVAAIYFY